MIHECPRGGGEFLQSGLPGWDGTISELLQGITYCKLADWLQERFGGPVRKVGLAAGFPCPGRMAGGRGGCTFCRPDAFLPPGIRPGMPVREQFEAGARVVSRRYGARMFIPYFQDGTPTNCRPEELEPMLAEAAGCPGVVGLSLCTRPDCLPEAMLDMLGEVAGRHMLWVELGLQTARDSTLEAVNRGHDAAAVEDAARRLRSRGIMVVLHVILGLPGETVGDFLHTAGFVNATGCWGVKVHDLKILAGTPMEDDLRAGRITLPDAEEYASWAGAFVRALRPGIVVHRLVSRVSGRFLSRAVPGEDAGDAPGAGRASPDRGDP